MAERVYLGGVTNTVMHLETDGTIHVEDRQDAEGILDYAAAGRNNRFSADSCDGLMRHEAEIPATVFQKECVKRGIVPFSPESDMVIELILADPQYAKFLAAPKVRDSHIIIKGAR